MTATKSKNVCFHTTGVFLLLLTIVLLILGFVLVCVFVRPHSGYWTGVGVLVAGALCSVCVTCYACAAFRRKTSLFGCITTSLPATGGPSLHSVDEEQEGEDTSINGLTERTKFEKNGHPVGEWSQRNGHSNEHSNGHTDHPKEDTEKGVAMPNGNAGQADGRHNVEADMHAEQTGEQPNGRLASTDGLPPRTACLH